MNIKRIQDCLLAKPIGWKAKNYCSFWQRFWCRAKGHPEGVWWYSTGNEPDMTCKNCGDDLG